ncbi:hypothetical protein BY996DRAFT_456835 [Phakopsora pachyrhizi]|uniref:Uncharacterized protein n=1 Tax=Phakopsora pachyrhizi TaxID=170000 RepID=A0AAV0BME6_PHAPC|nr:hypothetical protein BY996DRAFT_456835 [Phakopsora pachyrhizi]CAH7667993.1 hypothetical protein PPACK8108_LOCUS2451 [Phakopsora pachyrhizi]CAH7687537.1 hypothetical protein PPACK8108_LOCUS22335 [Phakopsora pachyrhizi]
MRSSVSIARATATLPRHWSRPSSYGQPLSIDPRLSKRQEGANKTKLILQNYLKRGIEPSPELLDSLDPTNLSYEGTISSSGSVESIRVASPSDERRRLLKKQTKRQSVLPSFFEPTFPPPHLQSNVSQPITHAPLTAAALTAHDHPAVAYLAAPSRVIRRATSFAGAMPSPPIIRIIKPEPECLDDHSNPSSRDPFYYDKVLDRLDSRSPPSPRRQSRTKIPRVTQACPPPNDNDSVGSDAVTAWFADQYMQAA